MRNYDNLISDCTTGRKIRNAAGQDIMIETLGMEIEENKEIEKVVREDDTVERALEAIREISTQSDVEYWEWLLRVKKALMRTRSRSPIGEAVVANRVGLMNIFTTMCMSRWNCEPTERQSEEVAGVIIWNNVWADDDGVIPGDTVQAVTMDWNTGEIITIGKRG